LADKDAMRAFRFWFFSRILCFIEWSSIEFKKAPPSASIRDLLQGFPGGPLLTDVDHVFDRLNDFSTT
jgi:hypothetical protein